MKSSGVAGIACMLLALTPGLASARSEKMWGGSGAQYLPQVVEWSLSDLSNFDQAKAEFVERDDGDAGWRLEGVAVRSYDPMPLADDRDNVRFRARHASISAWHALGEDDTLRFTAIAGRASRRTGDAVVLPAKTLAGFAGAELAWEHSQAWSLSIGAYRQGGWGGHSLQNDVLHMANGEPPAAHGLRASLRMKVDGGEDADGRGVWLGLDSHTGTRATGLGTSFAQASRHGSDISLALTSRF